MDVMSLPKHIIYKKKKPLEEGGQKDSSGA